MEKKGTEMSRQCSFRNILVLFTRIRRTCNWSRVTKQCPIDHARKERMVCHCPIHPNGSESFVLDGPTWNLCPR